MASQKTQVLRLTAHSEAPSAGKNSRAQRQSIKHDEMGRLGGEAGIKSKLQKSHGLGLGQAAHVSMSATSARQAT